jgi:hypothetical protein
LLDGGSNISGYGSYGIPGSGILKDDKFDDNKSMMSSQAHS